MKITRQQACTFLTMLHFETPGAAEQNAEDAVLFHVRRLHSIQFDPLNVVGRNPDLVLQSRIDGYRPEMLFAHLYEKRTLLDGFDKNLCIYPVEDYPRFARMRREAYLWYRDNPQIQAAHEEVLREIAARGALCSDDLDMDVKVRWAWADTRLSRAVLESLWMEGRLAIAYKKGTRRYYELAQRCIPAEILRAEDPAPLDADYFVMQFLRRLSSVGMLSGGASDAFLCVPMKARERAQALERLLAAEQILPVEVDGQVRYIAAADAAVLQRALTQNAQYRARIIAPLDNLLWDRRQIRELFGFDYRWEVYVPAAKRKYGYYVLPVMLGDRFIARFEAEPFRGGKLVIKHWWWEDGVRYSQKMARELRRAIRGFCAYLGAEMPENRPWEA